MKFLISFLILSFTFNAFAIKDCKTIFIGYKQQRGESDSVLFTLLEKIEQKEHRALVELLNDEQKVSDLFNEFDGLAEEAHPMVMNKLVEMVHRSRLTKNNPQPQRQQQSDPISDIFDFFGF